MELLFFSKSYDAKWIIHRSKRTKKKFFCLFFKFLIWIFFHFIFLHLFWKTQKQTKPTPIENCALLTLHQNASCFMIFFICFDLSRYFFLEQWKKSMKSKFCFCFWNKVFFWITFVWVLEDSLDYPVQRLREPDSLMILTGRKETVTFFC